MQFLNFLLKNNVLYTHKDRRDVETPFIKGIDVKLYFIGHKMEKILNRINGKNGKISK